MSYQLRDHTPHGIAVYIEEYLDPGAYLQPDDDPAEIVASLDDSFADEGGTGLTVDQMATYLASLPQRRAGGPTDGR